MLNRLYCILVFFSVIFVSPAIIGLENVQKSGHTLSGTQYDTESNHSYSTMRHGADGKIFLDPYFIPFIQKSKGQKLLDAGCGAGPWAIYAAEQGATVTCLDVQQEMIDKAKEATALTQVKDKIHFSVGDVAFLPFENATFQRAISINVGCNLPSTLIIAEADGKVKKVGLGPHFLELARVLDAKGRVIITAPASFDVVFTSNKMSPKKVEQEINLTLSQIKNVDNAKEIVAALNKLTEVNRATFVVREGKLKLVKNISQLKSGENIWRKLPGLTVPNRYHPEEEYIKEAKKAGFEVIHISRAKFKNEQDRLKYNATQETAMQLGEAYTNHYPFVVMEFKKIL